MYTQNKKIGIALRKAREDRGVTLKELGESVGLSESTVQKYEAGKIKNIDISLIKKFANALRVNPIYLLG